MNAILFIILATAIYVLVMEFALYNIWKSRFLLGRGKCFEIVRFGSMGIEIRLFN